MQFDKHLRVLWQAACWSVNGLSTAVKRERAVRQECFVLAVAIPLALFVGETAVETLLLIGSVVLVLVVELLNTAVEVVCDRITTAHDAQIGYAKDAGSAAVFVAIVLALVCWAVLLLW